MHASVRHVEERTMAMQLLDKLFANGRLVYQGYVDDARNTDNAWMETAAFHFHCEGAVANLNLAAGDDAAHAFWLDINTADATYAGMSENHKVWVDDVAEKMRQSTLLKNMRKR